MWEVSRKERRGNRSSVSKRSVQQAGFLSPPVSIGINNTTIMELNGLPVGEF